MDKTPTFYDLPDGPWKNEPNRMEWMFKGFPCLIRRPTMGHLCGYVAIPLGHPYYQKNIDEIPLDVHGGITWASHSDQDLCFSNMCEGIDSFWWIGFDCGHAGDLIPGIYNSRKENISNMKNPSKEFELSFLGTYRDIEYVKSQVESLAEQLDKVAQKEQNKNQ